MRPSFSLFFHLSLFFLSCCSTEDAEVLCVHMESCVLPCRFSPGHEPVINWLKNIKDRGDVTVYSFHSGQLRSQEEEYKGRTTLLEGFISGNAALKLTEVRVQDEGKYVCLTGTSGSELTVSYVQLKVKAPVLQVSVHQEGQQLVCRSENIYPRPAVTWSSSAQHHSRTSPSESGLFSVSSSVLLSDSENKYSCNISTEFDWRSATYKRNSPVSFSDSAATINCIEPETPVKSLVWKFNCEAILTRTGSDPVPSEFWKPFIVPQTESNSLVLKNLSQYQEGRYSCELSTESEDFIINTELIKAQPEQHDSVLIGLVVGMSSALLLSICFIILLLRTRSKNQKAFKRAQRDQMDSQRLRNC